MTDRPHYMPLPVAPAKPPQIVRFVWDYERLADHPKALEILENWAELIARKPNWSRERACWGCEHWQSKDGLSNLPFRPGAGPTAVETCTHCHYAMLDEVDNPGIPGMNKEQILATLEAMQTLRTTWQTTLMPKRKGRQSKRYVRAVRYDTVEEEQQGYAGLRTQREPGTSAFRPRVRDTREVADCGNCGKVVTLQRYWSTGPGPATQSARQMIEGQEGAPLRFIAYYCLSCGHKHKAPEGEQWPTYPKGGTPPTAREAQS